MKTERAENGARCQIAISQPVIDNHNKHLTSVWNQLYIPIRGLPITGELQLISER